ncbi:MAG TPA: hypothetical protein VEF72_26505, partial [Mycobacterium sp.]|nr:hypothetical protein [Mycobacterium sp.]
MSTSAPAVAGPVLDSTYRLDYLFLTAMLNKETNISSDNQAYWWAFRSACTPAGCVATWEAVIQHSPGRGAGMPSSGNCSQRGSFKGGFWPK